MIKLMEPATFGSSQSPSATVTSAIPPMIHCILSAVPVYKDKHQLYTVQAITESCAQEFFNSATTLAGVRGIPHGLQCHSLTAACLLGTVAAVRTSIIQLGQIDPNEKQWV